MLSEFRDEANELLKRWERFRKKLGKRVVDLKLVKEGRQLRKITDEFLRRYLSSKNEV